MGNCVLVRPYDYEITNLNAEQNLAYCGQNSGNIIWYEGVKNSIKYDVEKRKSIFINNDDKYILPMANHINVYKGNVLPYLDNSLEKAKNVIMIGIGAQLTEEYNTPSKLVNAIPEERIRALQNISKKCVSLGIRGEITAECLDLIGIHNYKVIGCPSFYSDKETIYQLCIQKNTWDKKKTVSINLSAYGKKQLAYILNNLKDGGVLNNSYFILQHMIDMPKTMYEDIPILQRHIDAKYPGLNMTPEEWGLYIKEHGKIFFNKKDWINFIKNNISISMGMRFHGNMAAVLAGVPAVWITHDSRTTELCEVMQLPHIDIESIKENFDIEEVLELGNRYTTSFWNNYCDKYEYYKKFLEENGLTLSTESR